MSELAKIAENQIRIRDAEPQTVAENMATLVTRLHLLSGFKYETNDIYVIASELTKDLRKYYKILTFEEINEALENGIRGSYGEYFGISVVTLNKFIKHYIEKVRPLKLMAKMKHIPALPQTTQPTAEELFEISKSNAVMIFEQYLSGKKIFDFANTVYNFLDKSLLVIDLTNEEKNQIWAKAVNELVEEKRELKEKSTYDRPKISKQIDAILSPCRDSDSTREITSKAKQLALIAFFSKLKAQNKHISELFNKKTNEK